MMPKLICNSILPFSRDPDAMFLKHYAEELQHFGSNRGAAHVCGLFLSATIMAHLLLRLNK